MMVALPQANPELKERLRRRHWRQYFLALRRRDGELASFHRQIAQTLQAGPRGGRPPGPAKTFRRVSSSSRLTGRPGPRPRAERMRQAAGKPAAAAKPSSEPSTAAGSISSSKATKVESVVVDRPDQPKRKVRKDDPLPGRADNEPGSGARISKKKQRTRRTCRRCGCTEDNACVFVSRCGEVIESCSWIKPELCSACLTLAERIECGVPGWVHPPYQKT